MSYFRFRTEPAPVTDPISLDSGVRVMQRGAVVSVELPFPLVEPVFYRCRAGELMVSPDIRLLFEPGDTLDDTGIASLLLFGACVPPLSPYREIRAFLPGLKYQVNLETQSIESSSACEWSSPSTDDARINIGDQIAIVKTALDFCLDRICSSDIPILSFSGGIDSSVLAARLSAKGRRATPLAHLSLGDDDPETQIAAEIAAGLGMRVDVLPWDPDSGFEVLLRAGSLYPQPFADYSSALTHSLSMSIVSKYGKDRVILDGTGAGGCFGLWGGTVKWQVLHSVPALLRRLLGELYPALGLWHRTGRIERYMRTIRRSTFLPILPFLITQSPLPGFAPPLDPETCLSLSRLCTNWVDSISRTGDLRESRPLLDLGLLASLVFAQKNLSPLKSHGFDVRYPYMEPEIVDLALSHSRYWPGSSHHKNVLKHLLAEVAPPEYVFRKKSRILGELPRVFTHPVFRRHLEAAMISDAPLGRYIHRGFITQALDYLTIRSRLPEPTYSYLWSVAFCNAWLSQLPAESQRLKRLAL